MKGRIFFIIVGIFMLGYPVSGMSHCISQEAKDCKNCYFVNEWNRTYGGEFDDMGYSIVDIGNGYLLGGLTLSYGNGNGDAYLIRVDKEGNEIWEKTYGGSEEDGIYDLLKVEDGYIIVGKTKSFGQGDYDAWLLKVDEEGNEIWNKTYGGKEDEVAYSIYGRNDGYLVAGITSSFGHGNYDAWLLKVDEEGNEIWNKTYGGTLGDYIYSIKKIENGYVMAGTKTSAHLDFDAWLIKVDNEGNEIWEKTYGGRGDEIASDVSPTEEGYILSGNLMNLGEGISDAFLIKVDEEGNEIWNKTYGGEHIDAFNAVMTVNDGYVAAGVYGLLSKGGGAWIVKTDKNGEIVWNKTIGGKTGDDYVWTFIKDGEEYVLVGSSTTYSRGGYDVWLIKTSQPQLEIEIQGGIGITMLIKNVGNETISNLEFSMRINGFVFFGKTMDGEISSLPPGMGIEVNAFVMGFGNAIIEARAGEISKKADCFILGPFVFIE